jgi:HD-GYP domain-containing protein (c-di-GMP phosphodiesterase class II)
MKEVQMRAIPIEFVKPDYQLAESLYTLDGIVLVKEGALLSDNLVQKILKNNIYTVYIRDIHSTEDINKIIPTDLRHKGLVLIKDIFNDASFRISDGTIKPKSIFEYMDDLNRLADDILYELSSVRNLQLEYIDIKSLDNYLYASALNVAILSVLIGWDLNIPKDMLKQIFIGGVFHDIGMGMLPNEVLYKKEALTFEEKKLIIQHPTIGHKFLKDKSFLSAYVKNITLSHHEYLDGSGYPNRKSGSDIHLYSQIVGIADIYDAMTSDRPYRRALPPLEAIEYLLGSAGRTYPIEIIKKFVKKINPYPTGTHVILNTGEVGVVDKVPENFPLRPKVRLIKQNQSGYIYEPLDLMKEQNITIKSVKF